MPANSGIESALQLIANDKSKVLGLRFGAKSILPGDFLARAEAQSIPEISYTGPPSKSEMTYLLVALDLDAPFPSFGPLGPILHAIQPGYKVSTTDKTTGSNALATTEPFVANYIGPAPPPFSSPHRYSFFLYEQPADFDGTKFAPADGKPLSNWHRMRFDLDAWEKKAGLGKPIAANYFKSN